MNVHRLIPLVVVAMLILPAASAIQFNSSSSMKYYSSGTKLFEVGTDGTITTHGNLNMQGTNNITNFFDTQACGSGEVVDRVFQNGSYACVSVSAEAGGAEDLATTLAEGWSAGSHNISLNGNNITDIHHLLNFFEEGVGGGGQCASGEAVQYVQSDGTYSCIDISGEVGDTDDQNLSEVLVHGNVANDTIDMSENAIQNVDALQDGSGTDTISFDGSNNVNIPSGNLTVSHAAGTVFAAVENTATGDADAKVRINSNDQGETSLLLQHNDVRQWSFASGDFHSNNLAIRDANNGRDVMKLYQSSGDIDIPNGNVSIGETTNTTRIMLIGDPDNVPGEPGMVEIATAFDGTTDPNGNDKRLQVLNGGGSSIFRIRQGTENHLRVDGSGNVDIPNGDLNFVNSGGIQDAGINAITFDGSQNVAIPNGELDVDSPSTTGASLDVGSSGINTDGDIAMAGTSPKIDLGNGMYVQRKGNNVIISDS